MHKIFKETIKDLSTNFDISLYKSFLFDEYKSYLKIQWLTIDTQKFYLDYINRFIEYSKFDNISCFDSLLKLKVWYNNLPNKWISNNTINKYYLSIVKYSNFLLDNQLIKNKHYLKLQKVKITKSLPNSLSSENIEIINNHLLKSYKIDFYKYRNYTIFQTFLNTWIRRNELASLKKEDVFNQYIKINNWKWNKDRIVYITKEFSKLLNDYLIIQSKNKEFVFCDYKWSKLDRDAISKIFTRIQNQTKIHLSPHLFRHTYASLCVRKWINLYTLQQQLWHTDLRTTSIYLYLNSRENWEEIQKLNM